MTKFYFNVWTCMNEQVPKGLLECACKQFLKSYKASESVFPTQAAPWMINKCDLGIQNYDREALLSVARAVL